MVHCADRGPLGFSDGRAPGSWFRAFEPEQAVVLVAVKVRLGEGCGAHEDGLGSFGSVVIPAEGEPPGRARLGAAAGLGEGRPGDAPLDAPAPVDVAGL